MYHSIMRSLNKIADQNKDSRGKCNYIIPFLEIIKSNLKYIDERISCDAVNNMTQSYQGRPPRNIIPIHTNQLNASGNPNFASDNPNSTNIKSNQDPTKNLYVQCVRAHMTDYINARNCPSTSLGQV